MAKKKQKKVAPSVTYGYNKLAEMIFMEKVIRYKELRAKEQTDEVKAEIKALDEYFRSDEFRVLTGLTDIQVENIIDGLKNGGKYYRYRGGIKLYHGNGMPN